jgi:Uri superfamily endonuclease
MHQINTHYECTPSEIVSGMGGTDCHMCPHKFSFKNKALGQKFLG